MRTICFTAFMVLILITSCKKQETTQTDNDPSPGPVAQVSVKRDTLFALGDSFLQMLKQGDQDGMLTCWVSPQDINSLEKKNSTLRKEFDNDSSAYVALVKTQLPVILKHLDDNGYTLSELEFVSLKSEDNEQLVIGGQNVATTGSITLKLNAAKDTTINIIIENAVMFEGNWYFVEEILEFSVTKGLNTTKVTIPRQQ